MSDESKPLLRLVPKEERQIPKHRQRDLWQWTCHVCEHDLGVATSQVMRTLQSPYIKNGVLEPRFSSDAWICVYCMARGKVTTVV